MTDWFKSLVDGFDRTIRSTGANTASDEKKTQAANASGDTDQVPQLFSGASGVALALGAAAGQIGSRSTQRTPTPTYEYGIYPAIGIARLGDHPLDLGNANTYNLGPERPAWNAWPAASYDLKADVAGVKRIKKQGCRFAIVRRKTIGATVTEELLDLDHPDVVRITWTVKVANAKAAGPRILEAPPPASEPWLGYRNWQRRPDWDARMALVLDPGSKSLHGRNQRVELARPDGAVMPAAFRVANNAQGIRSLGTAASDAKGNLIMFGGEGRSVSDAPGTPPPSTTFNNDDWFDDVYDGWVQAEVELKSGTVIRSSQIASAWVLSAPPDYAPFNPNLVSLWDVLRDIAVRELGYDTSLFAAGKFDTSYRPYFDDEIKPLLIATYCVRQTSSLARAGHANFASYTWDNLTKAAEVLSRLRKPTLLTQLAGAGSNMPMLDAGDAGDVTLTPTQYWMIYQWAQGKCLPGSRPGEPISMQRTRAALQQAIGAAFYPGIEVTRTIRNKTWFSSSPRFEFRFDPNKIVPGDVSKEMALPWQTDFAACSSEWWPTIRPGNVKRGAAFAEWLDGINSNQDMVDKWARLGWVDSSLVEVERQI